jgi:hypothetical protein
MRKKQRGRKKRVGKIVPCRMSKEGGEAKRERVFEE